LLAGSWTFADFAPDLPSRTWSENVHPSNARAIMMIATYEAGLANMFESQAVARSAI
jgi:hypothetical protein